MKSTHQLIQTTMVTEPTLLHKQQNSPPPEKIKPDKDKENSSRYVRQNKTRQSDIYPNMQTDYEQSSVKAYAGT